MHGKKGSAISLNRQDGMLSITAGMLTKDRSVDQTFLMGQIGGKACLSAILLGHSSHMKRPMRSPLKMIYRSDPMVDLNDDNNCSVIAFSNGFGMSYQEAYCLLEKFGRKHGEGMSFMQFTFAVEMFSRLSGYVDLPLGKPDKPMTVKSLPEHHPKGLFFFEIHRHVAVMVDGQVLCWCKGLDEDVLTVAEIRR